MTQQGPGTDRHRYSAIVLVGQVGLAAAAPIIGGVAAGVYLSNRWEGVAGALALIGGIVLGICGAVVAVYRVIAPYLE